MANTLFLVLDGPMQSWGERARWSVRDTAPEPTKSALVGLLGCALGVRDDLELRRLSEAMQLGVRCDRPGRTIADYHTIIGGVLAADGKLKRNAATRKPETVVTTRQYLCDALFVAAFQSVDLLLIERLVQALGNPVWPVFLGRKSCPPARPVLGGTGDYPDLPAALRSYPLQPGGVSPLRAVIEMPSGEGVRRRDQVGVNSQRIFYPRYTRELSIDIPGGDSSAEVI